MNRLSCNGPDDLSRRPGISSGNRTSYECATGHWDRFHQWIIFKETLFTQWINGSRKWPWSSTTTGLENSIKLRNGENPSNAFRDKHRGPYTSQHGTNGQMSKKICTTTGSGNSIKIWKEKVCSSVSQIRVPAHEQAHMGQMGKWTWRYTATHQQNSSELRSGKIGRVVSDLCVRKIWNSRPAVRSGTTIPLQSVWLWVKNVITCSHFACDRYS